MKSANLDEYQRIAGDTDQLGTGGLEGLSFMLLGLFGEVGTLLSALKKKQRDRESFVGYEETVVEEFGDVLWYFSNIASRASLSLSVLAERVFRDFHDWDQVTEGGFGTFADIQTKKRRRGSPESPEFESSIINLAAKVGLLLNDFNNGRISTNRDTLSAHLVEVFRTLIEAANVASVSLDDAVRHNESKIYSRWPKQRVPTRLFDEGYDSLEQLPRRIEMHIIEKKAGARTFVIQQCNGINIGSQITDNKITHDDYRFHDAFHLAYAGILGWSPVLRGLFKLKRKSVPKIDEAQDGARAILIEEGISTLIFHRALRLKYFESITSLDYSLLKLIPEFVAGYEVEKCHLWEWEKAILEGFRVFRELRAKRRGIVTADLVNRAVHFSDLRE
ncbi:MAG: nucleoside triphosphate pyrophosphohydrolase family protein [Verrucomicrobiaceae bacterium]|nr:nucleoside triphosphate pyrophosphohydrolase family protein [Verrucomicrobiaceae bacterium]